MQHTRASTWIGAGGREPSCPRELEYNCSAQPASTEPPLPLLLRHLVRHGVRGIPQMRKLGDVFHIHQRFQKVCNVQQLAVMHVVDERRAADCMLRLEHVRCRRVVHNDCALQPAPQAREVLHKVALVLGAVLAEQARIDDAMDVQLVEQGVGVLGQRCRVHHDLKVTAHAAQELVHTWTLDHVHMVDGALNVDRNDVVRRGDGLERTVHQRLVQIQNETLLALQVRRLLGQQVLDRSLGWLGSGMRHRVLL
mmetsp:Transcript_24842/g.80024  ORF Transcript_24842/g.80024 Transcript_24842/m.80024 type:complete len:252 (+) Transcript_24842:174-929(+)